MTFFIDTPPEMIPTVEQLPEIKPIKTRKSREQKHDFKDGHGRVPARRHIKGKGWVAHTAVVENSVYVGPRCEVFQNAYVSGNVRLEGNARVYGRATVSGLVLVKKSGQIYGNAVVTDNTTVSETARVLGSARVSGSSELSGRAVVCDNAQVISCQLHGDPSVAGYSLLIRSHISGNGSFRENCVVINSTTRGFVEVTGFGQILGGSVMRNTIASASILITDYAILADRTQVWYPLAFKNHAVAVQCSFTGSHIPDTPKPEVGHNLVLQQRNFGSTADLTRVLDELRNPNRSNREVTPVAGFPVRQVNYLATTNPGPRRVQRLQEVGT